MEPKTLVWYVAYGSNLENSGINHHLAVDQGARVDAHRNPAATDDSPDSRWIDIPHSLYFAGQSKTWAGPVAFLSLSPASGHDQARGRAFLLSIEQLQKIVQSENGYHDLPDITYAIQIPVGAWAPLPVSLDEHGYKGKYNAMLRLPDAPDSRAVVTLTTSRKLEMGAPSERYRSRVCAGLAMDPFPAKTRNGLGSADKHLGPNSAFVNKKPAVHMQWRGTIVAGGKRHGQPVVTLPKRFNGSTGDVEIAQGSVVLKRRRIAIWLRFEEVANAEFNPAAAHLLGSDVIKNAERTPLTIEMEEVRILEREPADAQDLPDSDVVHVGSAEAKRIGKWALFINDGVVGPVRVAGRTRIQPGKIRVAYAARTLLAQEPQNPVLLQPIRPNSVRWQASLIRPFHRLGEGLFGAPAIALRATEGLVGDEGHPIIRVDAGALDFIGAEAGDTVVVTWAHRRAKARVLLQTDLTRQRMEHQLEENTGQQLRHSDQTGGVASRISVPHHLRAWLSPSLRTTMQVPADTVVRVRRSFGSLLLKNSARLALPIAALFIGGLAIPNVPVGWWIVASLVAVVFTLLPLRLRQTNGKERKPKAHRW